MGVISGFPCHVVGLKSQAWNVAADCYGMLRFAMFMHN